jgi:hypothetical protein
MELDLISVGYEICWVMYERYSVKSMHIIFGATSCIDLFNCSRQ